MDSVKVDVFLSTSFDPKDKEINDFFSAVCSGLDLHISNVYYGANRQPAEQAQKLIERSQGLIAICPRREELANGHYNMPQAVNDEIAFACGRNLPILTIMEEGVNKGGFKDKFNTFLNFDRDKIHNSDFIEQLVRSIHEFKMDIIGPHQIGTAYEPADSHADYLSHLVELKSVGDDFMWEYSTTKKIVYTRDTSISVPYRIFTIQDAKIPEGFPPIEWSYEHLDSSNNLELDSEVEEHSAKVLEVRLKPKRPAEAGEYIKFRTYCKHRYLVPLWEEEVSDSKMVHLSAGNFRVTEGLLFIHRTKEAIIEYRFCREYGIKKEEIVPFVASYTASIDFEVESELNRTRVRVEDLGGSITVRMEIESALPGHLYGIAWNPKPKKV